MSCVDFSNTAVSITSECNQASSFCQESEAKKNLLQMQQAIQVSLLLAANVG